MKLIDADELYARLMARYMAHNLDDTRDMAARAAIMSCMEAVERSKTINISQPYNDHLTLDELREMEGLPVYMKWNATEGFYCIISSAGEKGLYYVEQNACTEYAPFALYGDTWLAYRCKPKGDAK